MYLYGYCCPAMPQHYDSAAQHGLAQVTQLLGNGRIGATISCIETLLRRIDQVNHPYEYLVAHFLVGLPPPV